tara:strand:+ start:293 stop:1171 length:879 start_codon:yes stop_codon:yes gene_type:complete
MNIINFESNETPVDPFKLEGSVVDIPMKEEKLEHFWDKKGIYKVDVEGNIVQGLGIVGQSYPLSTHKDFFSQQHEMLINKFPNEHIKDAHAHYRTSRDGAWALQDIRFPNIKFPIESRKHTTEVGLRNVSWHSVDGSASNNALFGAIDFFCTNGMITGEYELVKKKNTKHFDMRRFIDEIEKSVEEFYTTVRKYQMWANRDITFENAKSVVESLPVADRSKEKLLNIYSQEATTRGSNLWALYSSFTNYSSHTDNGFAIRRTASDHEAQTMLKREFEVASWVENEEFVRLAA